MKILRTMNAMVLVAALLVPMLATGKPRTFEELVFYHFDEVRKASDLSLAAQKIARNLPYDLLGITEEEEMDINMGKPISPELQAQVLERLDLYEKGLNTIRTYLINPQETLGMIYAFASTYPAIADQPLFQQTFDWLMSPDREAWLNTIAANALRISDYVQAHINSIRLGVQSGTIAFRNALFQAAKDLLRAVRQLEDILRDPKVKADHPELFKHLNELYNAARQLNLEHPDFVALRSDLVEKIKSLL